VERLAIVAVLLCAIPACATDRSLDDVALVSVRKITPEATAGKPLLNFIGRRNEPLMAIEFSTGEDLIAFAQDRDSMLRGKVFFCENEKALRIEGDQHVYDRKGAIGSERNPPTDSFTPFLGRHSYVVAVRTKVEVPAEPGAIPYDLQRDPRDLCLILRGGNVIGRTIASNVLTIPNATVRAALGK
jgi:hypothetical protein